MINSLSCREGSKFKTLVITNLSEIPLVYRIKKSPSLASLDLVIPPGTVSHTPCDEIS